mgnify:CR=1 FL=1
MNEGIIRVDIKRMMTRIMKALEFKTDPNMRQELLAAFKEDIKAIISKYDNKYEIFEDENLEETSFFNIEPSNLGGMGPISLPGVDSVGSGDVPAGQADDEDEDEEDKRNVLSFEAFVNELHQIKPFEPEKPEGEKLGEDDYEPGPANDHDAEMRERMKEK